MHSEPSRSVVAVGDEFVEDSGKEAGVGNRVC